MAMRPVRPIRSRRPFAQKGSLFLTRPTLFSYIATRDELEQSAGICSCFMVRSGKVKIESASGSRSRMRRKHTGSSKRG